MGRCLLSYKDAADPSVKVMEGVATLFHLASPLLGFKDWS